MAESTDTTKGKEKATKENRSSNNELKFLASSVVEGKLCSSVVSPSLLYVYEDYSGVPTRILGVPKKHPAPFVSWETMGALPLTSL